jgi:hypothetical protein
MVAEGGRQAIERSCDLAAPFSLDLDVMICLTRWRGEGAVLPKRQFHEEVFAFQVQGLRAFESLPRATPLAPQAWQVLPGPRCTRRCMAGTPTNDLNKGARATSAARRRSLILEALELAPLLSQRAVEVGSGVVGEDAIHGRL